MSTEVLNTSLFSAPVTFTEFSQSEVPLVNFDDEQKNNGPGANDSLNTVTPKMREQTSFLNLSLAKRDVDILNPNLNMAVKDRNVQFELTTSNYMSQNNQYVEAVTETTMRVLAGQLAGARVHKVYLNMDKLYSPDKSAGYNQAKMLAAYVQGCYAIIQSQQNNKGSELAVHQQCINFLERAESIYSYSAPSFAKAIHEVIEEEKREFQSLQKQDN